MLLLLSLLLLMLKECSWDVARTVADGVPELSNQAATY